MGATKGRPVNAQVGRFSDSPDLPGSPGPHRAADFADSPSVPRHPAPLRLAVLKIWRIWRIWRAWGPGTGRVHAIGQFSGFHPDRHSRPAGGGRRGPASKRTSHRVELTLPTRSTACGHRNRTSSEPRPETGPRWSGSPRFATGGVPAVPSGPCIRMLERSGCSMRTPNNSWSFEALDLSVPSVPLLSGRLLNYAGVIRPTGSTVAGRP